MGIAGTDIVEHTNANSVFQSTRRYRYGATMQVRMPSSSIFDQVTGVMCLSKSHADAMVANGLDKLGWHYIVLDDW